ncbi:MAG TPA: hypothetical protein ENI17_15335 [Pseudomonas xinjiangensis]|uniref:Lipoprotein n=2 Tax=root TaxID=1 RepID=A0A7V1BTC1_9GAMM|nr:hypothetical protein [Halopseudomonas xinjiangensis]HEC48975.1 hypothetical protein [Halopseudomonas xinjiangensis]
MKANKVVSVAFIALALGGCVSSKSYVDPKYKEVSYSDVSRVQDLYGVRVNVDFQRNGKSLPAVNNELRSSVERVFRASGVVIPTTGATDLDIKVTCNNVADMGGAATKGAGTGLTLGLVGTAVTDIYQVTIEFRQGGELITKRYDHAIHTTIGNKASPVQGAAPTSPANAFSGVVEDVILQFLKEMQQKDVLTFNELVFRNRA